MGNIHFNIITNITNLNRLHFVCQWLFVEQFNCTYTINEESGYTQNSIKLNYNNNKDDLYLLTGSNLFNEFNSIKEINFKILNKEENTLLFADDSEFGCDLFSMIFFCLSRYEEYYTNSSFDSFDRYHHSNSIAYKNKFLEYPVLDFAVRAFAKYIKTKYHFFNYNEPKAILNVTYDIDTAYYTKCKGILKGIFRTLEQGFFKKDVFDTYELIFNTHSKHNQSKPLFFVLASKNEKYNPSVDVNSNDFKKLVKELDSKGEVALHPGYYTSNNLNLLSTEKKHLENIVERKITKARMHYLKNKLPIVYQNLIDVGITEDYSMGYAQHTGFRAGTCKKFYWYNIKNEEQTNLIIYPIEIMDHTLLEDLKLTAYDAIELYSKHCFRNSKNNIDSHFLWHNHSIANFGVWKNWHNAYESIFEVWQQNQK